MYASAAQDAHGAVLGRALEDGVYPAMHATLRLFDRGLRIVADFDFRHSSAPFQRQHRDRLAINIQEIQRHAVPLQDLYFDRRLWMFVTTQKFVNPKRRTLPVAHAVNDQSRTKYAVAASKNARSGCHQTLRIDCD